MLIAAVRDAAEGDTTALIGGETDDEGDGSPPTAASPSSERAVAG